MDSNIRIATFQQSHLMRYRLLLVLPKENLIEEFMSLEWSEDEGFKITKLLKEQSKFTNLAYGYYGMNYLVLLETGAAEAKRHRFVRIYKLKNDEEYELVGSLDPFNEKISSGMMRVHLSSDENYLCISLEREDCESVIAYIKSPFHDIVTSTACIPKQSRKAPTRTSPNGAEVYEVDCNFDGLNLQFDEPTVLTFQSEIEDFGIITLEGQD